MVGVVSVTKKRDAVFSVLKRCRFRFRVNIGQVPESVAFAFLAHVRPHVALHAAWVIGASMWERIDEIDRMEKAAHKQHLHITFNWHLFLTTSASK